MAIEKAKWYALKVGNGQDKKVAQYAEALGKKYPSTIESVISPTQKTMVKDTKTKKMVIKDKTFLNGYVFIHADLSQDFILEEVRALPGVLGWLGTGKKPSAMTDEEVNRMLGNTTKETPQLAFRASEVCNINEGPFKGFKGVIEKLDGDKVYLSVKIFGRDTKVETTLSGIEKIV